MIKAAEAFKDKTTAPNRLWQTDFTYLKVAGWGWHYLSTVLGDFSRFIVAWKLCATMKAQDVTATLDLALAASGLDQMTVVHRPRLLSDNGASYFPALERRWQETVGTCRGNAEPSYRTQGRFTHNKYETAASAIIRDIGEALTFTRAFDLVAALHLLQIERGAFRTEEALEFCTVEALRRTAGIGRFITEMREAKGTIRRSFRKEVDKNTRAAAAKLIRVGIGVAALALAKREAARADKERATRASYWQAVQAIEAAPV